MQGMQVAAEPLSAPPYATECAMTLDGKGVSINFLMVLLRASGSQPERIERNRQTDTLLEKMRRNLIDSRHFIIAPEFDHCTKIGKYQVCTLWLAFSSIFMPQIIYILSIQALGG